MEQAQSIRTTNSFTGEPEPKPRDDEIDLFGLTHVGKVRKENQDHFLVCTVHQQAVVHGTSLPNPDNLPLRGERLASLLLVADGVGSGAGAAASERAAAAITEYATNAMRCYHSSGRAAEQEFLEALTKAAMHAHDAVRAEAATRPSVRSMATTLTIALAVWPWLYVLQVGDSRCYYFAESRLRRVTRDQTIAQDLVDQGALPAERAADSPLAHVLASAIGGQEAAPVVTRVGLRRGGVALLCSDGLTKHVSDEEIGAALARMTSSEQVARELVELALERGGSDNVTVLVGRARPSAKAS